MTAKRKGAQLHMVYLIFFVTIVLGLASLYIGSTSLKGSVHDLNVSHFVSKPSTEKELSVYSEKAEIDQNLSRTASFSPRADNYQCAIGLSPWKSLNLREELQAFAEVFLKRPGGRNIGGTGFFHAFGLWCIVRSLNPTTIIESGIHNGVGTWILRQAAGKNTTLILVSPLAPGIYQDKSPTTRYFTGEHFRDFRKLPWNQLVPDKEKALIFFDDHQAGIRRIKESRILGFRHIVFDDNYIPGHGDNLSAKKLCNPSIYLLLGNPVLIYQDNFAKESYRLSTEDYVAQVKDFRESVQIYSEFPPTWNGPNRFGIINDVWKKITQPSLFTVEDFQLFTEIQADPVASEGYTHLVYIELNH